MISVVLCTTGVRDTLPGCLASLRALEDPRHEVIVVENAARPVLNAAELAAWGARLVREPRRGLDVARNRGRAEARGAIVAYVDDDCAVDANWLAGFRDGFADPDVGFVTGRTRPRSLARRAERHFESLFSFDRGEAPGAFDSHTDGTWLDVAPGEIGSGCNMAFRSGAIDAVGGFDEALDMGTLIGGGGDLDMFARLLRAGVRGRYVPEALVEHQHRRTAGALAWQVWGYGLAQGALATKAWQGVPRCRRRAWGFWKYRAKRATYQFLTSYRDRRGLPAYLHLLELAGLVFGIVVYPLTARSRPARIGAVAGSAH